MDFYQTNYTSFNPMFDMDTQFLTTPSYPDAQFVKIVNNCAAECFSTMARLASSGRERQLKLLHDCARICASQVIYTVVGSGYSKQHAAFCSIICEDCGKECAKHPDQISQHCARVCLHCAEMCKKYSMGGF